MDIVVINCAESWVAFFQTRAGLWDLNVNQNGTSSSKIRLS